ncbi:hypothetical protein BS47DRAFT_1314205 [Hydnum rufescens UP504]|uniref:C3H1-type domain-containing protein n=1 Tax=Hydnum rufescens UP504 TaxID=1448309 RepID=A0A9P6B4Q6_9AGAM|nr:hypothetical protein BS47DRAFT_1314205 [Hydnum rufescens UP504]
MARQENGGDHQRDLEVDGDREGENREKGARGGGKPTKAKDLSHVPCKFYRQGACTAGASCPFSHLAAEPGQQKGICQWYIKGSCKFGHKCALAHVLPGQPLSMDRKNKRAEQANAQGKTLNAATPTPGKERSDRENKRLTPTDRREGNIEKGASEATVPSTPASAARQTMSSRPPMMIGKAPPTVSATGSEAPLHDSDFRRSDESLRRPLGLSSFAAAAAAGINSGSADRSSNVPSQQNSVPTDSDSHSPPYRPDAPLTTKPLDSTASLVDTPGDSPRRPSPIPQSRSLHRANPSSDRGFGPIGSPPATSWIGGSPSKGATSPPSGGISLARARQTVNGFSPATSPPANKFEFDPSAPGGFGTSPFSTPGSTSLFVTYGQGGSVPTRAHHKHTVSVGDHHLLAARGVPGMWDSGAHRGSLPASTFLGKAQDQPTNTNNMPDDDLEEFLPSSLNELLTPDERSRRMNRNNPALFTFSDSQPRFVNSVPANNLLNNIRGLWVDGPEGVDGSSTQRLPSTTAREGRPLQQDALSGSAAGDGASSSFLGTSNASAAFLSGHLHRTNGITQDTTSQFPTSSSIDALHFAPSPDVAFTPSRLAGGLTSAAHGPGGVFAPNDSSYYGLHQHPSRPLGDAPRPHMALSPSSRALRSHEPGQSLPQGLAAGLSRLHLIPATNPVSPPPGSGGSPHDGFQQQQTNWAKNSELRGSLATGSSPSPAGITSPPRTSGLGNLSATNGAAQQSPPSVPISTTVNSSLRRPWFGHPTSSPLSRPTIPDDAMFDMDDES